MPEDWFKQNAPKESSGGDWFQANAPKGSESSPLGEDFFRTIGQNISSIPSGLWNTVVHPIDTLKSLAVPMTPVGTRSHLPGSQEPIPEMTPGEMLGHVATIGGLGVLGKGLGEVPALGRAVRTGLRDTTEATIGKPPGAGIKSIPTNILRAYGREKYGVPETFEGKGGLSSGVPQYFAHEVQDLPVKVVGAPPSGVPGPQMHQSQPPSGEVFGPKKPPPVTGSRSAPLPDLESLKNEMRSAGIPEEGVQNPAIQDLFAKNRKGPQGQSSSGLGTPPPSTTPIGEGHFSPGGRAQQIMATNAQVKNLNVASSLRAKGITPEKWLELPLDKQNELIKEAHPGHREYVNNPAPNRPGRGASEGIMDIHKVLTDLWNTLP